MPCLDDIAKAEAEAEEQSRVSGIQQAQLRIVGAGADKCAAYVAQSADVGPNILVHCSLAGRILLWDNLKVQIMEPQGVYAGLIHIVRRYNLRLVFR